MRNRNLTFSIKNNAAIMASFDIHGKPSKYKGGSGSSVGIATDYRLDGPGSNPCGDEFFRTCPDRPWGPPSLM